MLSKIDALILDEPKLKQMIIRLTYHIFYVIIRVATAICGGHFSYPMDKLVIKGARQHNLKNITLEVPKDKLVVFTGLSGSGKSSLAFDTIYAEGQRRYVESLSSYARQFLGIMDKPDVDAIEGLSPAISIDQKSTSHNPRSTVGTVTEIYDYLRVLYARIGRPYSPISGNPIHKMTNDEIVEFVLSKIQETREFAPSRFAP